MQDNSQSTNMKNIIIFALLNCFVFPNLAKGQEEEKEYDFYFGLYSNWGISSLGDNAELNQYLGNRSYPEISRLQGTFNFIELESKFKKIVIRLQDYRTFVFKETIESSDYMSNINIGGRVGWIGYEIFSKNEFYLYPMFGYESSTARLKLSTPNENTDFGNFIDSSNSGTLNKKYTAFRAEICLRKTVNDYMGVLTSVGYRFQNSEDQWTYFENQIQDGPGLNVGGLYVNIGLQVNTKIFKTIFKKNTNP